MQKNLSFSLGRYGASMPQMPDSLPSLVELLTRNVPRSCRAAVACSVFPALATHLHDVRFRLIDGTEDKEPTFMTVLMAKQSSGKSAVNKPIEYILRDITERDQVNRAIEKEWLQAVRAAGSRQKPERPQGLVIQVLSSDMTNAAFVQRLADAGGRFLYTNLEEIELLNNLKTSGTKDVGKIICLAFDNSYYGQERVSASAITDRVPIRWNWNASTTIQKGLGFFKSRLVDGTLSRLSFCTIVRDDDEKFKFGQYDESYAAELKPYIDRLNTTHGLVVCNEALTMAERMHEKCMRWALESDDDAYRELAHRAVTIAYMKAMVLYIADGCRWSTDIERFAEWSLQYDMWCKCHFFGNQIREAQALETVSRPGERKNLYDLLSDEFRETTLRDLRHELGLPEECKALLRLWKHRNMITYDPRTGIYTKTRG